MLKKYSGAAALLLFTVVGGPAAAQPAPKAFEVASIKPSPAINTLSAQALMSGQIRVGLTVTNNRVDIGMMSLSDMIRTAYGVKPFQVTGPDWMAGERFDITAKLPDGATKDDVNEMLKSLLVERFGLAVHHDQQERPVYALVVGKNGPKLTPSQPNADAPPAGPALFSAGGVSVTAPRQTADGGTSMTVTGSPSGPMRMTVTPNGMRLDALQTTMAALADNLTNFLDRPVLDQTGISGTYQVAIDISMQDAMATATRAARAAGMQMPPQAAAAAAAGAAAIGNSRAGGAAATPVASDPDSGGASIFESVQKLGLQLEKMNAPVDVIVVDKLEKTPKED